ncbi:GTPase ObgE, partial [Chloroflexota bacterium]
FDSVQITVMSGDGGNGAISFRREKFVPYGGPDGGDGGAGGSIFLRADPSVDNLEQFRRKRRFRAEKGQAGQFRRRHGRNGEDTVLKVPLGTVVRDVNTGELLADLVKEGQEVTVVAGGRGGAGNIHFATSTNQAPVIAQQGEGGESRDTLLEMRLIADVGIIGLPNAGKSTLLSSASAARPKIASYPFTTLEPVLGVVEVHQKSFVLAEIPGLVEDAHIGKGLGHEFLRHLGRTRILLHLVDGGAPDPAADVAGLNRELELYDPLLLRRPQIIAINKIDRPDVASRTEEMSHALAAQGFPVFCVSAVTGQGVPELMLRVQEMLEITTREVVPREPEAPKIFRPAPKSAGSSVLKEDGVYVISAPGLERLYMHGDPKGQEMRAQMRRYLARLGVTRKLTQAGIMPGDKVRCGSLEWVW